MMIQSVSMREAEPAPIATPPSIKCRKEVIKWNKTNLAKVKRLGKNLT